MAQNRLVQFFNYTHLPEGKGRDISALFSQFVRELDEALPDNPEKSTSIRKLLEAKDCAVRATFYKAE